MTTFEKCKHIRSLIIRVSSEILCYSWDSDFCKKQIKKIPDIVMEWEKSEKTSFKINPNEMYESELLDLGFCRWSEEEDLLLIPLWMFPFLSKKIEFTSIVGSKVKLKEMDSDHRGGCLAYEVYPKK